MSNNLIERIKAILPKITAGEWHVINKGIQLKNDISTRNQNKAIFINQADAELCALAPDMARYILEQDKPAEVEWDEALGLWKHSCTGYGWWWCGKEHSHKHCPECGKRLPTLAEMEGLK